MAPLDGPPERRLLRGWKEIGGYLGAAPRSAQRYAAELGLPVHRAGAARGSVSAYADELDAWVRRRSEVRRTSTEAADGTLAPEGPDETGVARQAHVNVPSTRRRWTMRAGLALGAAVTGAAIWTTLGREGAFSERDSVAGAPARGAPSGGRLAGPTYQLWVRYPNGSTASIGTTEQQPAVVQLAPSQVVVLLQPSARGDRLRIDVYEKDGAPRGDGPRRLFGVTELVRSSQAAPLPVTLNFEAGPLELAWVGGGD